MNEEQKDKDFVKLFRSHMDDMAKLAREAPMAYDLLMLLLKHMDGSNALCASNVVLQELMSCGKATVCRAVKHLKDNGWICVLKSGNNNVYIVNPDVAWTSYANQREYCQFTSNVLLSSSENAEYLKNPKATNHFKTIDKSFIKAVQEKSKRSNHEQLPGQIEIVNTDMTLKAL